MNFSRVVSLDGGCDFGQFQLTRLIRSLALKNGFVDLDDSLSLIQVIADQGLPFSLALVHHITVGNWVGNYVVILE